jgi:NADH-quinone oxidoreductase subunit J
MITLAVFILFSVLAVTAAVLVVVQKNVMHSVLYLAFAVLATAGVFFSLQAEYLGAIQILVYAGVIVNLKEVVPEPRPLLAKIVLVAVPVATGVQVAYLLLAGGFPAAGATGEGQGFRAVAETLFGSYLFPFELASVLLLAVLVGAIVVARRKLVHDPD